MEAHDESRGSLSPTCSLSFFDCLATPTPREAHQRASHHIGVEREMKIMYQQPHLVPPMKLTVYDEMPATPRLPPPSAISQLVSQGRNLASRASSRASVSTRKRFQRPSISQPIPVQEIAQPRRPFRRLELSIYLPSNRLSDLPEFDNVDFADDGAIQLPPRALLRAKSEEVLARVSPPTTVRQAASMYQDRPATMHTRQNTTSSIISTSRPPSEYDALHSHPVSMISMPGLPPQILHQHTNSITILSPIQDEFTPPASSAMIDGMVSEFPTIESKVQERKAVPLPPQQPVPTTAPPPIPAGAAAPLKFKFRSRTSSNSTTHSKSLSRSTTQSQTHVSNSINHSHSSSISSSYSTVTTMTTASMSFSEHRRKKSQFYQCQPYVPKQAEPVGQAPTQAFTPPKPLALHTHSRNRTLSSSTVSSVAETVDTDIMSIGDDQSDGQSSATTAEAPVVQDVRLRSRNKSFSKPIALVKEVEIPVTYANVLGETKVTEGMVVKELQGGVVRSPGVGLAF